MKRKEYVSKDGGSTFYYRDPEKAIYHRERGLPAWRYCNGDKVYWENNRCHRLDGFANDCCHHKDHSLNGQRLFFTKIVQ